MNLLLLEDDLDLGQAVVDHLQAAGHSVTWCRDLAQARAVAEPTLALIDLQLPDGDGLSLLQAWRAEGREGPVIVLTARDQVSDRIRCLQAGADDYLVKPFDLDEMLARVSAVARRSALSALPMAVRGHLRLDTVGHQAWRDGEPVDLTQMEWAVLACLAQRAGRIYSRGEIEGRLHGLGLAESSSNSMEVIISRLRKKLGTGTISTHRGLGYRLER